MRKLYSPILYIAKFKVQGALNFTEVKLPCKKFKLAKEEINACKYG